MGIPPTRISTCPIRGFNLLRPEAWVIECGSIHKRLDGLERLAEGAVAEVALAHMQEA